MTTEMSAIRSSEAAFRKSEREQQRFNDVVSGFRRQNAQRELTDIATALDGYNAYMQLLFNLHRNALPTVDWAAIAREPEPEEPPRYQLHELQASQDRDRYRPTLLDRLLKSREARSSRLNHAVAYARMKDQHSYESSLANYLQARRRWAFLQELSKSILAGDPGAYARGADFMQAASCLKTLGASFELRTGAPHDAVHVFLRAHSEDIVPDYIRSLSPAGKLLRRDMAIARFNQLVRDYISSAALRIAADMLALLPVPEVIVHVRDLAVNRLGGCLDERVVLSVSVLRSELGQLQADGREAFAMLRGLRHHIQFTAMGGLAEVEELSPVTCTGRPVAVSAC